MSNQQQATYCLLCDKNFMSAKHLKRHQNYLHRHCEPAPYVCTFCNCGFEDYSLYENHTKAAMKRSFSRKTKKRPPKTKTEEEKVVVTPAAPPPLIVYETLV